MQRKESQTEPYRSVSMEEALVRMAQTEHYLLLDVRRPEEYAAGHLPGAVNLPNESFTTQTVPARLKEVPLFVYCRSGVRSRQAAAKLAAAGCHPVVECGGVLDYKGPLVN